MAAEEKRYPPSERKLARLWAAGSSPANPALVGAAALPVLAALVLLGGEAIAGWIEGWVREALVAASEPATGIAMARVIALRGGLLIAAIGGALLAAALAVQAAQAGRRSTPAPSAPAGDTEHAAPRFEGWRAGRALLLAALAAVVVAAAVRAMLVEADALLDLQQPLEALAAIARSVGLPLAAVLIGVAVLDTILGRAAWVQEARMTRREVEEEMRETEGHPLTRDRRSVARRRPNA